MSMKLLITIAIFLLGLLFCLTYSSKDLIEGLKNKPRCANLLIQRGDKIELMNTNLAKIPGVNPLLFNDLEEYIEFTEWQRSQGIDCPILYLKEKYDAQGALTYHQMYGTPTDPKDTTATPGETPPGAKEAPKQLLMDSHRNDDPYNTNSYPGFDSKNQYQGTNTPLDKLYSQRESDYPCSADAMSSNWCGEQKSQFIVSSKDNITNDLNKLDETRPRDSILAQNKAKELSMSENLLSKSNEGFEGEDIFEKAKKQNAKGPQ